MCARFTLTQSSQSICEYFGGLQLPLFEPRYNIAPTQPVLCLRHDSLHQTGRMDFLRWGLVPSWASDLSFGSRTVNARGETVAKKPAFRKAFQSRRCVVLADGFYEWKTAGKQKMPFYISPRQREDADKHSPLLLMAGLWESWKDPEIDDSPTVQTCTIITTEANATIEQLHDRMPVLINQEDLPMWLNPEFKSTEALSALLQPCDAELLQLSPVNPWLNKVGNEGPRCLEPPDGPEQGLLF